MALCTHIVECPFFNNKLKNMPTIAKSLQTKYCQREFDQCARFLVNQQFINGYSPKDDAHALVIETVIDNLFPQDADKARLIISQLQR